MTIKTNWCVITGAPSSGKTTIINALSMRGFQTAPEVARAYLQQLVDGDPDLFNNHRGSEIIQDKILELKLKRAKNLNPDELIFFDRGLPDSLAYYRFYKLDTEEVIGKMKDYQYACVFYLEGLPVVHDGIRRENDAEARLIGNEIYKAYHDLGYKVIKIPPMSVEQRLESILSSIPVSSFPSN